MNFRDFDKIRSYTHGRVQILTGDQIGHLDDLICMATAAFYGWESIRLEDVSPDYVRGRLDRDIHVLNLICDFAYAPEPWESNVLVFDHHDPERPTQKCSAHLLMEELVRQGLMHSVPSLMDQISAWDVVGPQAVPQNYRPDQDKYTAVLAAEPKEGFDFQTASFIIEKLYASGSIREFVDALFFAENDLAELLAVSMPRS